MNTANTSSLLDETRRKSSAYYEFYQIRSNQRIQLKQLYSLIQDIDITTFTHENYTQVYDNILSLKQIYEGDKTKINHLLTNLDSTVNDHAVYPTLNNANLNHALHIIHTSIEICNASFVELNHRLTERSLESMCRAIVLDHYYLQSLSANDRCIVENTVWVEPFETKETNETKENHKFHVIYTKTHKIERRI